MIAEALFLLGALSQPAQDTTIRLPAGGVVRIESEYQSVRLEAGSGDFVSVRGARAELQGSQIQIESAGHPGDGDETILVTVPFRSAVRVELGSGTLVATRVPQHLHVESMNGAITTNGGTGNLRIETVSGRVAVRQFTGGRLDIDAMSGPVDVDGATGTIRIEALNESVLLRNIHSSSVHVETLNGQIEWHGDFLPGSRHQFEAHNGTVTLHLPRSVNVRLTATTFLGNFRSTIPSRTRGEAESGREERDIVATYGTGAARLRIETFNGDIVVRPIGES